MINKKKAVHISANTFDPFPMTTHTKSIWLELAKCVDEYTVLARNKSNNYSYTTDGKINLSLLSRIGSSQFWFFLLFFNQIAQLNRIKPDYIICQCPVLGGLAGAVYKTFNKKVVLTLEIHGEHILKARGAGWKSKLEFLFFRFFSKLSFSVCDNIRSLSPSMTENIISTYGEKVLHKIKFVPNRVDLQSFPPKKNLNFTDSEKVRLITVGAFSPIKNHLKLISDLSQVSLDFSLKIIGQGSLKYDYLELIEKLNLTKKIKVIDSMNHEQLAKEYRNSDVYIHYSKTEAVPRVILEAQASNIPVVTTNVGYLSGLLRHKENALFLNSTTSEEITLALTYLLDDKNYKRITENGYQSVVDNFGSEAVYNKYRQLIQGN